MEAIVGREEGVGIKREMRRGEGVRMECVCG